MRYIIMLLLAGIIFASCENTAQESRRFSVYYDVDSLINAQLNLLADIEPIRIKKVAKLNGEKEVTDYLTDSLSLAQEFNVFRKANINKPAYEGTYLVNEIQSDSGRVIEYLPKENANNIEVQSVHFFYEDDQLVKIEAHVVEDHWLYDSDRTLTISLNENSSPAYIDHYQIRGTQKMILRDRVQFTIEGVVIPSEFSAR